MGSLFARLFLWFWLVMVVMGVSFLVTQHYWGAGHGLPSAEDMREYAAEVQRLHQEDGRGAVAGYLHALGRQTEVRFMLLRADGRGHMGRTRLPGELARLFQSGQSGQSGDTLADNQPRRVGQVHFRAIALAPDEEPARMLAAITPVHGLRDLPAWVRLLLALIITAGLSALLAARLSAPLQQVRAASRRLADGDLTARVPKPGRGRDEITMLGKDFNAMAARLETLVESRIRLLQDVSHELRSPLARLQVALELTRRQSDKGHQDSAAMGVSLDRMDLEIHRLDALIAQVLGLAKLEAGTVALQREPVALQELLAELRDDAAFEAEPNGARVLSGNIPQITVQADRVLLRSALDNVLRNALRHSPAGGAVHLTAQITDRNLTLTVRDEGPGIPAGQLERIFEPFVRISEARERESGGHGLGLAIVRRAMEAHGGTAKAENHPSGGLQITLRIPLENRGTSISN